MSRLWCSGDDNEWGEGMVSGESSAETDSDLEQVFFDSSNYFSLVPHYRAAAVSPRANELHDALAEVGVFCSASCFCKFKASKCKNKVSHNKPYLLLYLGRGAV